MIMQDQASAGQDDDGEDVEVPWRPGMILYQAGGFKGVYSMLMTAGDGIERNMLVTSLSIIILTNSFIQILWEEQGCI